MAKKVLRLRHINRRTKKENTYPKTPYTSIVASMVSKEELDNSLEYLYAKGMGIHDTGLYVLAKSFLGTPMNKQALIDFFNSKQEADGGWTDVATRMFTTHRVLLAYYILGAKPAQSLDAFFKSYDTWPEAVYYITTTRGSDARDFYHIVLAWCTYYWQYPPWLDSFFTEVEKNLDWTTAPDYHKRTHTLYTYVWARHPWPNLDGIIDATINAQSADGSWPDTYVVTKGRPVYNTSIQISLLNQVLKLYPDYRTSEIQNAIAKSAPWVNSQYKTQVLNGKTCGYFGNVLGIEDALITGILGAGQTDLLQTNVDMTWADIVQKIGKTTPPSAEIPFWLIAGIELVGIAYLGYYLVRKR